MSDPSAGGYTLSQIGKGNPLSTAAPTTGSYTLGDLGGHPGASAPADVLPNPTAAIKAPSKGGGLFSGIFHQAQQYGKDVRAAGGGVIELGKNLGQAVRDVGQKVVNTGGAELGNAIGTNLDPNIGNQFARSTSWSNSPSAVQELNKLPALSGSVIGIHNTEAHALGLGQALASVPTLGQLHPAGSGFEAQTKAQYEASPLQASLGDLANVALLSGAGAAAAPEEGALAGTLGSVAEGAGKAASAPLTPYLYAPRLLGAAGSVAGSVLPDAITEGLSRAVSPITDSLRSSIAAKLAENQVRTARGLADVEPANILRENQRMLDATGANADEQAAGTLRARYDPRVLQAVAAHVGTDNPVADQITENLRNTLDAGTGKLTPAAMKLALTPSPATSAYEGVLRDISAEGTTRALTGKGLAPGESPLSPEQTVPELRQSVVDRLVAGGKTQAQAEGDIAAVPSEYRAAVGAARSFGTDLEAQAKEAERVDTGELLGSTVKTANPELAATLRSIAADIEPLGHIEAWQGEGAPQAPAFLHGTGEAPPNENPNPVLSSKARYVKTSSSQLQQGIATAFDSEGQQQGIYNDLRQRASNTALQTLVQRSGSSPLSVFGNDAIGEDGGQLDKQMQANGWQAINTGARNTGEFLVKPADVDENTTYVPKALATAMAKMLPNPDEPPIGIAGALIKGSGKLIDVATQHTYRDFLAASPHFLVLRAVGDAFVASIRGGIPLTELTTRLKEGAQLVRSGEEPAVLSGTLNDTAVSGGGLGNKIARVTQTLPRAIDLITKSAVFLQKLQESGGDITDQSSPEYQNAAVAANKAFNALSVMDPAERAILARVIPMYPWAKSVAEGLLGREGFVANSPVATALIVNLGHLAVQDPNGFKQSSFEQELDPASIFGLGGGAINPVIRAIVGAALGYNLATGKPVTREGGGLLGVLGGGLTPRQGAYFAANQILPMKALLSSPASALLAPLVGGKVGTPLDQNLARYQSGQLKLSKGRPEPAYLPAVHTPVGTYGSYVPQLLGVPESPKQTPQGTAAHAKAVKTANKTAANYAKRIAQYRAKGIQ